MMNKEEARLLDRLYKDLYLTDEVLHHSNGNKYDKFNNIAEYMNKLETIHIKVMERKTHINYLKKLYYDKYIIKREDIPESYYKRQQQIALERGFGHIEIKESQKKQLQDEIINNQKASLDIWIDYLLSEDAKVYPFWAKYWAFQGMLKLGVYDKENETFNKRTKETTAPFADLNREALSMSIDSILKTLNKENIEDDDLNILIKSGSFQKIYSYILSKVLKDNTNIPKRNIGKWVKYDRGSDHMPLVNSLKGYNTGWCTAGESTAKMQLQLGDFYVYYTLDENNEYKVPRVAIRMENSKIAEIRGIAKNQNLETDMEEVVEEKIKDFPDKDKYYKTVQDMKMLTTIYKKHKEKLRLTENELRFLYELDDKIIGFGYQRDPRILEIQKERDKKEDLSQVFNCDKNQIALSVFDIKDDTVYYKGDLEPNRYHKKIFFPRILDGNLMIDLKKIPLELRLPDKITGSLNMSGTPNEGFILPQNIGSDFCWCDITSLLGIGLPKNIGKNIILPHLLTAQGVVFPQKINGSLNLNSLQTSKDLKLPKYIKGDLRLNNLFSADGLELPQKVDGEIYMINLKKWNKLIVPESLNCMIHYGNIVGHSSDLRSRNEKQEELKNTEDKKSFIGKLFSNILNENSKKTR